jgi:hypothetical protein
MSFGRDWWQARRPTTDIRHNRKPSGACKSASLRAGLQPIWRCGAPVLGRPPRICIAAGQSSDLHDARFQRSQLSNLATGALPVVLSVGFPEKTTHLASSTLLLRRLGQSIMIFRHTVTHAKTASPQTTPLVEVYCPAVIY